MTLTTCIFDAYGTLFDVTAAARQAANEEPALADCWQRLADLWRSKQLEYSWLRAVIGAHTDFWEVTQNGLDWAMEALGLSDPTLRERLLQLYWELSAYAEVPQVLGTLKAAGLNTAILSNGSPDMLSGAVDSAAIGELLDDVLSVETVGIFKPARVVYEMVGARFGTTPDQVLFVSSNGWDIAGAAAFGFQTAWVNRMGNPVDRMPWTPHHVIHDLSPIPKLAGAKS